jgi:hypothetical protein
MANIWSSAGPGQRESRAGARWWPKVSPSAAPADSYQLAGRGRARICRLCPFRARPIRTKLALVSGLVGRLERGRDVRRPAGRASALPDGGHKTSAQPEGSRTRPFAHSAIRRDGDAPPQQRQQRDDGDRRPPAGQPARLHLFPSRARPSLVARPISSRLTSAPPARLFSSLIYPISAPNEDPRRVVGVVGGGGWRPAGRLAQAGSPEFARGTRNIPPTNWPRRATLARVVVVGGGVVAVAVDVAGAAVVVGKFKWFRLCRAVVCVIQSASQERNKVPFAARLTFQRLALDRQRAHWRRTLETAPPAGSHCPRSLRPS